MAGIVEDGVLVDADNKTKGTFLLSNIQTFPPATQHHTGLINKCIDAYSLIPMTHTAPSLFRSIFVFLLFMTHHDPLTTHYAPM